MTQAAPRQTGPRPVAVAELPPPNGCGAERAVLVVAMATPASLGKAFEIAPPSHYYDRVRQRIATAVTSVLTKGELPDETTVARWLVEHSTTGQLSTAEVTELGELMATPFVLDAEQHARVIREHYVRRQRISIDQWKVVQHREAKRPVEDIELEANERLVALIGIPEAKEPPCKVLGPSEVFAQLQPVPWAIQGLDVCPGAPTLFAGYGYSGKSMALQALCLQVAAGMRVWGSFEAKQGGFVHLDWEQGEYLSRLRYQRIAYGYDITPQDVEGRMGLVCYPTFYLDESESFPILEKLCAGRSIAIFDSFRAACRHTDENSSEARVPLDMLARLSERTGCSMLVIHHARKPKSDDTGSARDSIRGSGALYDACGSVFVLEGKPEDPERTVHHCKARVSGKTQDPMTLRIEDWGDPGPDGAPAGLRVTVSKAPTADERGRAESRARDERFKSEVRELFKRVPQQVSIEAIAAAIGRAPVSARLGLRLLIASGEVVESGSTKTKRYDYVGQ